MEKPDFTLASAEQIRQIAGRAVALLNEYGTGDPFDEEGEIKNLVYGRLEYLSCALRFCADTARELKDASLLPLLAEALYALELHTESEKSCEALSYAIQVLLSCGAPLSPMVRRLSRHERAHVRSAIASGLLPKSSDEIALLEGLSQDKDLSVRRAARENLKSQREIPWWQGKFSTDPLPKLSPEEAERLKPIFERLSELLDASLYRSNDGQTLAHLVAALPDALLFDLIGLLLSSHEAVKQRSLWPLLRLLLERKEGAAMFRQVLEEWRGEMSEYTFDWEIKEVFSDLPRETLLCLCHELLLSVHHAAEESLGSLQKSRATFAARILAKYWPGDEDASEVLDAVLNLPRKPYEVNQVASALAGLFRREDLDPAPFLSRVFEARLGGYEGPWEPLAEALDQLLDRLPAETLRPVVEKALEGERDKVVAWGIKRLSGRVHDPERDPPPPLLLGRLLEVPKYQRAVLLSPFLTQKALPSLRQELRGGRLGFLDTLPVLRAIRELYGLDADASWKEASGMRKKREAITTFLGPEALQGPPTEEEWGRYRAVREHHALEEIEECLQAFTLLPKGPWHPNDRAFFERHVFRWREGEEMLSLPLMYALLTKPSSDDLPLIDELLARCPRESRGLYRGLRAGFLKKLDIPEEEELPPGASTAPEWMDEPEDEDEE